MLKVYICQTAERLLVQTSLSHWFVKKLFLDQDEVRQMERAQLIFELSNLSKRALKK